MSVLARTRLLQLASQAFPIGGYSHSQGLEAAIESRLVCNEASVQQWISDALRFSMGTYELPCLLDMRDAWAARDVAALNRLNDEFLAARESAELRNATVQMGFSMRALLAVLPELPHSLVETLHMMAEPSLPCVWSGASSAWSITRCDSTVAYLWSWAENQVLVAMKSVPIGQSSGQRILLNVGLQIAQLAQHWESEGESEGEPGSGSGSGSESGSESGPGSGSESGSESGSGSGSGSGSEGGWWPETISSGCGNPERRSNFAPGLAILSSQHETQYSRLFRS
jgi:urease accessory protein